MSRAEHDQWVSNCVEKHAFSDFFEIQKELGRGATSVVHKCLDTRTGQHWAAKIIKKKVDKRVVSTEIGILLKVKHVNIIRMKEIFETDTQYFLVLELVTGGELFDRVVSRGHYSEKDAAVAVREMLQGCKYLHDNGIIHRDLKPENLLYESLSDNAKLKIADFGLSKIVDKNVTATTVCGTPGYCAPEVIMSKRAYSFAVDLWSIGVIAYILLCGYEPFYDDDEREMYKRIIKGKYEYDEPFWNGISINAKNLVTRLLSVDDKKRPTSKQALDHEWVIGIAAKTSHMEKTQTNIKKFNAKRKLKAMTDIGMMLAGQQLLGQGRLLSGQTTSDLSMQVTQESF